LLFHLVELEWNATFDTIFPILEDTSKTHRQRLHLFIEKFYESEVDEGSLRQAVSAFNVSVENTREYRQLVERADSAFNKFIATAIKFKTLAELKQKADFIHQTLWAYSNCIAPGEWADMYGDAKMMADMLCDYFKIQ
jgi:hypothetical protein